MKKLVKNNLNEFIFGIALLIFFVLIVILFSVCPSPNGIYNVMNYGAVGDGKTDDAKSIQAAIDDCTNKNGGQVLFPEGHTFISSPLEVKSNCDIHIASNTTLKAIEDENAYKLSAFGENESEGTKWIWAKDAINVKFSGMGTIDGSYMMFMGPMLEDSYELHVDNTSTFDPRPHTFTLENISRLRMSDLYITGSAYWTVHLIGCNDAQISGLSIENDIYVRNSDGIDVDHSKNVRISDCSVKSGDDCICIKNRREYEQYGSCEDITISNCTMKSSCCAVKLGTENMDLINNVMVNNCVISDTNRGIGIQNRDEGSVNNVTFSNITINTHKNSEVWWGEAEPITITNYPRAVENNRDAGWRFPKGATEGKCGEVKNIYFNNINCTSENGCFIGGEAVGKISNIYFNNIDMRLRKVSDKQINAYDKRPCAGEAFIYDKAYGIYAVNTNDININSLAVFVDPSYPSQNYGGTKFGC